MLIPAKTKYRKAQKGGKKILGVANNGNSLKFGAYGLKALEPSKLNSKQIESARKVITNNPEILDLCKDIPLKAYELNGGQLRDWSNPFSGDDIEFKKWVFYQKGLKVKDKTGRTFWFNPKWKDFCPY